jgi:hypothetical protein
MAGIEFPKTFLECFEDLSKTETVATGIELKLQLQICKKTNAPRPDSPFVSHPEESRGKPYLSFYKKTEIL